VRRCYGKESHEGPKVPVRCYSIKSNLVEFRDISSFKEVVVNGRGVKMVGYSVDKDKLASKSSVLNLFEKTVVEPRDVCT